MDLPSLRHGAGLSDALNQAIEALLVLKAGSGEKAMIARVPVIEAFLAEALGVPAPPESPAESAPESAPGSAPDRREIRLRADGLFRDAVQGG